MTTSPTGELQAPGQYDQDFAGVATEPFSDEIRKVLAERPNHDDVEVKPDGICYMPGVWYRRQLTRAFGAGGWALKPNAPTRTMEGSVLWSGSLYALGRWVGEAVGGCDSAYMAMADRIQSAKTDCLSKICGHGLAMATELWDKTWREAWQAEYCTTYVVASGKDQGKTRWKLKEKREPRAADLMGAPKDSPGGAPSPEVGPKPGAASDAVASTSATLNAAGQSGSAPPPAEVDDLLAAIKATNGMEVPREQGWDQGQRDRFAHAAGQNSPSVTTWAWVVDAVKNGRAPGDAPSSRSNNREVPHPAAANKDTGEAASPEAYAAIAGLFRSLKLMKKRDVEPFLRVNFGVETHTALTAVQADAAHALLMAWGRPVYAKVMEGLRASGAVRT